MAVLTQYKVPQGETMPVHGPIHAIRVASHGAGAALSIDRGPWISILAPMAAEFATCEPPQRIDLRAGPSAPLVVEISHCPGVSLTTPAPSLIVPDPPALPRTMVKLPLASEPAMRAIPKQEEGQKIELDAGVYLLVVGPGTAVRVGRADAPPDYCTPLVAGTQLFCEVPKPCTIQLYGDGETEIAFEVQ